MKLEAVLFAITLFFLQVPFTLTSYAQSKKGKLLNVECKPELCIYGDPSFCDLNLYKNFMIYDLNSKSPTWDRETGVKKEFNSLNKIMVDFSLGDQMHQFIFLKADMDRFLGQRLVTLKGTYEDGFDWVDGYHTRSFLALSCNIIEDLNNVKRAE